MDCKKLLDIYKEFGGNLECNFDTKVCTLNLTSNLKNEGNELSDLVNNTPTNKIEYTYDNNKVTEYFKLGNYTIIKEQNNRIETGLLKRKYVSDIDKVVEQYINGIKINNSS
jgi:hypothetical protein